MMGAPRPSARLSAHAGAAALGGLVAAFLGALALGACLLGKPGPAVALALLASLALLARPGPAADLDKEAGRGP